VAVVVCYQRNLLLLPGNVPDGEESATFPNIVGGNPIGGSGYGA